MLRLSSALALAACLVAQLAGSVHSASVRHVACAEHGGVVELHAERTVATATAQDALDADDEAAHHEHCARCALPASARAEAPPAPTRTTPAASPARPRVDTPTARAGRYRLAPKGSPPRSAIG